MTEVCSIDQLSPELRELAQCTDSQPAGPIKFNTCGMICEYDELSTSQVGVAVCQMHEPSQPHFNFVDEIYLIKGDAPTDPLNIAANAVFVFADGTIRELRPGQFIEIKAGVTHGVIPRQTAEFVLITRPPFAHCPEMVLVDDGENGWSGELWDRVRRHVEFFQRRLDVA